jgi:hypothetical protein
MELCAIKSEKWFYEFIHIKLCYQSKEEKTMVNKKFWLGMLVLVLVFGLTVVGCAGVPFTRISSDGTKTITAPDGTVTVIDLRTDGKGGTLTIKNTDNVDYWYTSPSRPDTRSRTLANLSSSRLFSRGGVEPSFMLEEDGEYEIFYRRIRDGEKDPPTVQILGPGVNRSVLSNNPLYEESSNGWSKKSVYVSNEETFTISIP